MNVQPVLARQKLHSVQVASGTKGVMTQATTAVRIVAFRAMRLLSGVVQLVLPRSRILASCTL